MALCLGISVLLLFVKVHRAKWGSKQVALKKYYMNSSDPTVLLLLFTGLIRRQRKFLITKFPCCDKSSLILLFIFLG